MSSPATLLIWFQLRSPDLADDFERLMTEDRDIVRGSLETISDWRLTRPADVPGAWNEKVKQAFALVPANDAQGCLQDIHWSMGGLGYFPTYTLGNLYAAQLMVKARQDLGDLDADFRKGEFGRLKGWLNERIHRQGQRYRANELCQRVTGKPLSHRPLLGYLRAKYAPLYSL